MRKVGVDPGSRDFITAVVEGDSKSNPQVIRYLLHRSSLQMCLTLAHSAPSRRKACMCKDFLPYYVCESMSDKVVQ